MTMKFAPLVLLLLAGCETAPQVINMPAPIQAQPISQFGHINPIQLPPGEFFDGWVVPEISNGYSLGNRCYFSTTTKPKQHQLGGVNTLRNHEGIPVLIVKDPQEHY